MDAATHRDYRGTLLLGLLLFNGISSVGGGLALMTGLDSRTAILGAAHGFPQPLLPRRDLDGDCRRQFVGCGCGDEEKLYWLAVGQHPFRGHHAVLDHR